MAKGTRREVEGMVHENDVALMKAIGQLAGEELSKEIYRCRRR